MKTIKANVPPVEPGFGWMNRILSIDLSSMQVGSRETTDYVPAFLGGRGLAAKIAWDEYPRPIDPFDADNPLMIFPGALTGTRSPYSGRTMVCTFSPQGSPHRWFTRSSIGGWIGGNIKRAGYDGIVVTGRADHPVRILVVDDEVSILPADDLWGVDALDTLEALSKLDGGSLHSLVIGPAGEHLSHIATIQTGTSSACGQGGFGAVMGAKKLKAISVAGTYEVRLARPDAIRDLARQIAKVADPPKWFGGDIRALNKELAEEGGGTARLRACSESCLTPCQTEFRDMPGSVHKRRWSGDWICVSAFSQMGFANDTREPLRNNRDWQLDRSAAFEMNVLANRYGLNEFDILEGMVPWLIACQKSGLISEFNGKPMNWSSPELWDTFLHAVAYREGMGDVLAKGGWQAAHDLDLGLEYARNFYAGWGHTGHWDGRSGSPFSFPFWVSSVLQWLADTRDPFSTGHGSIRGRFFAEQMAQAESTKEREGLLAAARAFGRRVYGSEAAADPYSGYEDKARVGYFHTLRPIIKDCLPADDFIFPLLLNKAAPDYRIVLHDSEGNDFESQDAEYHLFRLGTGTEWSRDEFEQGAARVYSIERALQVRHWNRDRAMDETVLPYFDQPESFPNPLLEERHSLDREQFKSVLDEFYRLHGWEPETGQPTKERLDELGLRGVHEQMTAGASTPL